GRRRPRRVERDRQLRGEGAGGAPGARRRSTGLGRPPDRWGLDGRPIPALRRCLGVDIELVQPLPGVQARAWSGRGVQWQVHVQPVRAPWGELRYLVESYSPDLPELLPAGRELAVHRGAVGAGSVSP